METLNYILNKFNISFDWTTPVELPNCGRVDLARWFNELNFKKGVEVGVAEGKFSQTLCEKNPQAQIYGVDPYIKLDGYTDYVKGSTFNKLKTEAYARLTQFPNYTFIEKTSVEGAKEFEDESLDFVYIDANHRYPFVIEDLKTWLPKLKFGGIMSGHDYFRASHIQVREALADFARENKIDLYFVLGREAKDMNETRDDVRSWFFVKE